MSRVDRPRYGGPVPVLPLRIYNYTEKAQFGRVWNAATLTCRGLIVDDADCIVARPLRKFFNLSEYAATFLPPLPVEPFVVFEKVDGALGIRFPTPDGPAIATRGSFTSAQALWATAYYRRHYGGIPTPPNVTYLFEIVAPQFRVVVDYGDREALVLLAVADNATGLDLPLPAPKAIGGPWPGPIVERFDGLTDRKAFALAVRVELGSDATLAFPFAPAIALPVADLFRDLRPS